jgi:hypothetical protein
MLCHSGLCRTTEVVPPCDCSPQVRDHTQLCAESEELITTMPPIPFFNRNGSIRSQPSCAVAEALIDWFMNDSFPSQWDVKILAHWSSLPPISH